MAGLASRPDSPALSEWSDIRKRRHTHILMSTFICAVILLRCIHQACGSDSRQDPRVVFHTSGIVHLTLTHIDRMKDQLHV